MSILRNRFILSFILLGSLFAISSTASEGAKKGYAVVKSIKIEVEGENARNRQTPPKMKTKEGALFVQEDFDEDLKSLLKVYDRVEPKIEFSDGRASISLLLTAKPCVKKISIQGNKEVPNHKILKTLQLFEGDLFDREKFLKHLDELKTYYLKRGFFESKITYEANHNASLGHVDLVINIQEGCCGRIKKLDFEGLSKAEISEVKEFILTKQYSKALSWFNGAGLYHPDLIEQDSFAIANYLHNLGYADATVTSKYNVDEKGNIHLCLVANKGPLYTLGHIHVEKFAALSRRLIAKQISSHPDDIYNPEVIWDSAQRIRDIYAKYGYINTNVDVNFVPHPTEPVYHVNYHITEGCPYKVGLIKINGNQHTKHNVILHESSLFPGDTLSRLKLETTERRLRNTGYFQSVSVYTVRSQLDPLNESEQYRDIYIDVKETTTGNLGLFLGFSSLDNLFGGVELSENNFDLFGVTKLFTHGLHALRGGGETLFLKANFGDKVTDYTMRWTRPHFLNTPWILGVELDKSINKAINKNYIVDTYGGNVSTTYILNENVRFGIYYRGTQTSLTLRDEHKFPHVHEGPNMDANKGFISATGVQFVYDSVDNPRNPAAGLRGNVNFEVSGLGGSYHFTKLTLNSSIYRKLTRKGVLKIKAESQFIKPFGTTTVAGIPISERFFLGGETTVRGYKPFMIGPKFAEHDSDPQPQGGVSSLLLSEEFQYPLFVQPNIGAFVFLDSGFVGLKEYSISLKDLYGSAGFGLRFDVMNNVPIMLGFGWPFRPTEICKGEKIDISQRFFFALGGIF